MSQNLSSLSALVPADAEDYAYFQRAHWQGVIAQGHYFRAIADSACRRRGVFSSMSLALQASEILALAFPMGNVFTIRFDKKTGGGILEIPPLDNAVQVLMNEGARFFYEDEDRALQGLSETASLIRPPADVSKYAQESLVPRT